MPTKQTPKTIARGKTKARRFTPRQCLGWNRLAKDVAEKVAVDLEGWRQG
jgi:hypothetical protein